MGACHEETTYTTRPRRNYLPCKVQMRKERCSTNRCRCRKAGINCTDLCRCSDSGKLCENMHDNEGEDDDGYDDDDGEARSGRGFRDP